VGDIARAVALHHFDLLLPQKHTGSVEAWTRTEKTVQVKETVTPKPGLEFTLGKERADYLLFFAIHLNENTATVIYNGPKLQSSPCSPRRNGQERRFLD